MATNLNKDALQDGKAQSPKPRTTALMMVEGCTFSSAPKAVSCGCSLHLQWLDSIIHLNSAATFSKKASRIERLAFPVLGDMPINAIKSPDILTAIKCLIDKNQLETAHCLHSESGRCWRTAFS